MLQCLLNFNTPNQIPLSTWQHRCSLDWLGAVGGAGEATDWIGTNEKTVMPFSILGSRWGGESRGKGGGGERCAGKAVMGGRQAVRH
jgi:hypothetical protein